MKLSDQQKEEINSFLNEENVSRMLFHAQICILSKSTLEPVIDQTIQKLMPFARERLSAELRTYFNQIMKQVIESLAQQQIAFFNLIAIKICDDYLLDTTQDYDLDQFIYKLAEHSSQALGFKIPKKVMIPANCKMIFDSISNLIKSRPKSYPLFAFLITMIACVSFAMSQRERLQNYFIFNDINMFYGYAVTPVVLILSVHLYENYYAKTVVVKEARYEYQKSELPHYELNEIRITDAKTGKMEIEYAAIINIPHELSATRYEPEIPPDVNSIAVIRARVKRSFQASSRIFDIPRLLSGEVKLTWRGSAVLFGDEKGTVPDAGIHELHAPFFARNQRWYSFLNRKALQLQGLDEKSEESHVYTERLVRGKVVPGTENTGIKQLNEYVRNIKIGEKSLGTKLLGWSVKTIGTLNRLLGEECSSQVSNDGTQHRLVDFYLHMKKGPGH